jgi:hypothetical protein
VRLSGVSEGGGGKHRLPKSALGAASKQPVVGGADGGRVDGVEMRGDVGPPVCIERSPGEEQRGRGVGTDLQSAQSLRDRRRANAERAEE